MSEEIRNGDLIQRYRWMTDTETGIQKEQLFGAKGFVFNLTRTESERRYEYNFCIRWMDTFKVTEHKDTPKGESLLCQFMVVTPALWVGVYMRDREYLGPAEGGDWSWSLTHESSFQADTAEEAKTLFEKLAKQYKEENKDRREPTSVLSEGHYQVHLETHPGEHEYFPCRQYC